MNDERILSLCVSVVDSQGRNMLFRVADVNEGKKLVPFFFDSSLQRGGENTNMVFSNPRETQPDGTITFWNWHSPDGYRQLSYIDDAGTTWFEYVRLKDISSTEDLHLAFSNGLDIDLAPNRQYLIEFSLKDKLCSCVHCKSSDFTLIRDKYVLIDNIYHLDYYEVSSDDIFDIRTNYLPGLEKKFYSHLKLPEKTGTILVRTPADTVKQAIQKRIGRCTEGFSKGDKRVISEFVKNLSSETIIKHIADECRCSVEEAQEYIDEFVRVCERYFSEDDFTSSVLLHLVEYNSNIGTKYQEAVKAEWERQNVARIDEANAEVWRIMDVLETEREKINAELAEAKKRLEELLYECEEYERVKAESEAAVVRIQKEYDEKLSLADDVAQKVRNKISEVKSDLSSFLSEYALFTGVNNIGFQREQNKTYKEHGNKITETPETIVEKREIYEYLKENLEAVGVDKSRCSSLGAYLLSAYFKNIPLIIAGYGSELIIDAVSATLYNKEADKIVIEDNNAIIEKMESKVLAVHNGFGSMTRVLSSVNGYVYFVSQTSEELVLEPRSTYNYALPLFSEYFITDKQNDELYGTISDVQDYISGKERKPNFPDYIVPLLAYKNYKRLLGLATEIYGDITPYDITLLTTLPIMLSLNKREELLELLSSMDLSDKDKVELYKRIGEKE